MLPVSFIFLCAISKICPFVPLPAMFDLDDLPTHPMTAECAYVTRLGDFLLVGGNRIQRSLA